MTDVPLDELLQLPAQDRLDLAQKLWESLGPEAEKLASFLAISDRQIQVLEERNADLVANPSAEQDWEDVEVELWPSH